MQEYEFDYAIETVFQLLSDPDFVVERSLALGDLESECEVYEEDERLVVASKRQIVRDLPSFLKKVFDPVQRMALTEKWVADDEGGYSGEQHIVIDRVPLTITASIELFPTDDGCCYRITHRAKAKIPLIGGKLEKFAQAQAQEGAQDDMRYLAQSLES